MAGGLEYLRNLVPPFVIPVTGIIVLLFSLLLFLAGLYMTFRPVKASEYLKLFASSAYYHFTEQGLRLLAGISLLLYAPRMLFPGFFTVFGVLITVTSVILLFVPWQRHKQFADLVIPYVIRFIYVYALLCCGLGAFTIYAFLL